MICDPHRHREYRDEKMLTETVDHVDTIQQIAKEWQLTRQVSEESFEQQAAKVDLRNKQRRQEKEKKILNFPSPRAQANMLKQTSRTIAKAIHELKYLGHADLTQAHTLSSVPSTFDIVEGIPIQLKIICHGKVKPCDINLTYQDFGEIRVSLSVVHEQPSRERSEVHREGRMSNIKYFDKDPNYQHSWGQQKLFTEEYIFMTVTAEGGAEL